MKLEELKPSQSLRLSLDPEPLVRDLLKHGQLEPLIVSGSIIIDGNRRYAAFQLLKQSHPHLFKEIKVCSL